MTVFLVPLLLLAAAIATVLRARRRLLALDARCKAAAAAAEAEAARLQSLFPALVGLVRAFAPQEREAMEAVARAYAGARRAHSPQARLLAETRLADSVRALQARAQGVPQIRDLEDFRELRLRMAEAERRLAAARSGLRAATQDYNRTLARFPESLFALRLSLLPRDFYDIGADERAVEIAA
jgi:LemA protein